MDNKLDDKIDFVILWVNDQDLKWKKKKEKWQKSCNIENEQPERYRYWNNLHYQFRAIEKYAPWVNHIYLVTDNQKPDWLNLNTNVTIIDHKEIMDEDDLPTFNSRALELNIHRIPNLTENFVYFNDDIFIIDKVNPEDFFKDNLPRERAALNLIMPKKHSQMSQVIFNNTALINDTFNKRKTLKAHPFKWVNYKNGVEVFRTLLLWAWPNFSGFKQVHLTGNYQKKTYQEIWNKYPKELKKSSGYKFRSPETFNQYLIRDWQLASNNFKPQDLKFGKLYQLNDNESVDRCADHIKHSKTKIICVNDTELLKDFTYAKNKVNSQFEEKYPKKSKYEI